MAKYFKFSLYAFPVLLLLLIVFIAFDAMEFVPLISLLAAVCLALGLSQIKKLKMYQYTAWIIVAIVLGMLYPSILLDTPIVNSNGKALNLFIVQLVMFGMGTQMSISYFKHIRKMKKAVIVGVLCQFTIMPLVGYLLTRFVSFEPEIAAGVILIGCCASGLASNVMSYLAGANLDLSITLTAVATLLAPIMTPLLMSQLLGTDVNINFADMFFNIIKIVVVPIGAALLFDYYKMGSCHVRKTIRRLGFFVSCYLFLFFTLTYGFDIEINASYMKYVGLFNYLCGAIIIGLFFYFLFKKIKKIVLWMPYVSMGGIIYFTAITIAQSRDYLMQIGLLLLLVAMAHNVLGYFFGYGLSRLAGLGTKDCRTVALEVGMQNGGMAFGLAGALNKLATLGLAAAVFSPWMNISGSILANYWKRTRGRN